MAAHGRAAGTISIAIALLASTLPCFAEDDDIPEGLRRLGDSVDRREMESDPLVLDALRFDAALCDVCFVDLDRGWAVGDRGTIWHTRDGGRTWGLQRSGVDCRLESVCFVSPEVGWAAGWRSHPYLHTGAGVLLSTTDGGQHWEQNSKLLLPALRRIGFSSPQTGWAIGAPSGLFPSGVLATHSGGRGWDPVIGPRTPGWLCGDFLGPQAGAMAGCDTAFAVLRQGTLGRADAPNFGLREPRQMRLSGRNGWLVGDGGLILTTLGQGSRWQFPSRQVEDLAPWNFDFAALAVRGSHCWIAGSPGTQVLHTPDGGETWTAAPTGQNVPIRGLHFVDDRHGWAVGQLGTILATADGGRTWRSQRSGGRRLALLGFFSDPQKVPLELFARYAGNEGYLSAVEIVGRRDLSGPGRHEVALDDRAHEAMVHVGAAGARTAWQFPLPPRGAQQNSEQLLEQWNRIYHGAAAEELQRQLVRAIRTWQPEVIVTHGPTDDDPAGRLLYQSVLTAVSQAADGRDQHDPLRAAGLEPWQVRRVYGSLRPNVSGEVTVSAGQLAERLGCCVGDLAMEARALVDDRFQPGPESLGFQPLFDESANGAKRQDLFAGIVLPPGKDARRPLTEPAAEAMEFVRRIAQKRRFTQAIVERTGKASQPGTLLAQVDDLTRGLDPNSAGEVLFHLAQSCIKTGNWQLAAEAFEVLLDRHWQHPLARPAAVWLAQYYASGEAAWRGEAAPPDAVRPAAMYVTDAVEQGGRLERLRVLEQRMQQAWPDLLANPAVTFSLASVERQGQQPRQADRFYAAQRPGTALDVWAACAQGEAWLNERRGQPPKPVARCAQAKERPRLDGKLDDPTWEGLAPLELRSPARDDQSWPASVMLAYDDQFLFVAVRARQAPGVSYPKAAGERPRDADLAGRDRVEILLDIDRDYATHYRLAVDHRGWTAEDCWGDATWNPNWFVAAAEEDGGWNVEIAIPLDQLSSQSPSPKTAWAIGLQRIVPGSGLQSWNSPAAIDPIPEGFGYLLFE